MDLLIFVTISDVMSHVWDPTIRCFDGFTRHYLRKFLILVPHNWRAKVINIIFMDTKEVFKDEETFWGQWVSQK
ncbi:hypothetical protein QVD17_31436 [Tagetes erecta]|uniref:Uncharacterized protein n=1 Tax=Tagetes erecta TaxID=13708 RepID=A0AAD8NP70_TARER|nr:hypothetical protein QVD17_31436 [Tagetes erecta]